MKMTRAWNQPKYKQVIRQPMITLFIIDKMSSYIAQGMSAENAARFTRGELEAIYKNNHHSRDASGAFRVTPPPEAMDTVTAMKKADVAIMEILKCCAPDDTSAAQGKRGFEKMAEYAKDPP